VTVIGNNTSVDNDLNLRQCEDSPDELFQSQRSTHRPGRLGEIFRESNPATDGRPSTTERR